MEIQTFHEIHEILKIHIKWCQKNFVVFLLQQRLMQSVVYRMVYYGKSKSFITAPGSKSLTIYMMGPLKLLLLFNPLLTLSPFIEVIVNRVLRSYLIISR